ncbi:MAG TPA: PIN domain nuclease [Spirochaetia bacterium]|nr:PIN domain nuclease [Spirochaetia bacterium]
MSMQMNLYLDTSIPSAYYDTSKPSRQRITQEWFKNDSKNYKLFTSVIALQEIQKIKNDAKRENVGNLIVDYDISILELTEDIKILAEKYIRKGAIPKTEPEDALHIATAVVNKVENLVSWNFKHIVSINPIKKINEINKKLGYEIITISSLELFGGYKYENL